MWIFLVDLEKFQCFIVLFYVVGVGEVLDDVMVWLVMLFKVNSLVCGFFGICCKVIDVLIVLINVEVYLYILLKGLVGVFGDLVLLVYMLLVLIGESWVCYCGEWLLVVEVLVVVGLELLILVVKEGLVLFNGIQVFIVYVLCGLFEVEDLFVVVIVCGGFSVEVMFGLWVLFDVCIYVVCGQCGQIDVVVVYCDLFIVSSEVVCFYEKCDKVQDFYLLCCQLQVMGVCLIQMCQVVEVLEIEVNVVFDNLLVFVVEGDVIFGGNFYVELVVMVVDNLVLVLVEIGLLLEWCILLMMDMYMLQLLLFLVVNGGVNFGFMIVQVIVVVLVSDNKVLVYLVSVDSLLILVNQEDYVLMVLNVGKWFWVMVENVCGIFVVEWLGVCQGLDFCEGLKSFLKLEQVCCLLCDKVLYYQEDCFFVFDIEVVSQLFVSGCLNVLLLVWLLLSF